MSEEAPIVETAAPADTSPAGGAPVDQGAPPAERPETFSRDYVEELRREAADNRIKARELEQRYVEKFKDLDPDEAEYILNLGQTLSTDPATARQQLAQIVERLDAVVGTQEPKYLTEQDLERREQEKAAAKAQEDAVNAVLEEAKGLGYSLDTAEMASLLWMTAKDPAAEGSIAKAHELMTGKLGTAIEEARKAAVAEYLETVRGNNASFPPIGGDNPGNVSAPAVEAHKSDKLTKQSAMARLDAFFNGSVAQ